MQSLVEEVACLEFKKLFKRVTENLGHEYDKFLKEKKQCDSEHFLSEIQSKIDTKLNTILKENNRSDNVLQEIKNIG